MAFIQESGNYAMMKSMNASVSMCMLLLVPNMGRVNPFRM